MRRILAASVAFALLLHAPVALADHSYSHRYVLYGKVVDEMGAPVEGELVAVRFVGLQPEGPCANQPGSETDAFGPTRTQPTTNARGEFMFCFHLHFIPRDTDAKLRVEAGGAFVEAPVDAELRAQHVVLVTQLARSEPVLEHVVAGRLWEDAGGEVTVEGIRVYGRTPIGAPVTVRLGDATMETRTNNYGDFAVRIPVRALIDSDARVLVHAANRSWEVDADEQGGATWVRAAITDARAPPTPTAVDPPTAMTSAPTLTDGQPLGGPAADEDATEDVPLAPWLSLGGIVVALALRRRA